MDWNTSGAFRADDRTQTAPILLRLLSRLHHPPARLLVPGCGAGHEVRTLHARGYAVLAMDTVDQRADPGDLPFFQGDFLRHDRSGAPDISTFIGTFDLICEQGLLCRISPGARAAYMGAAAALLRPGGQLFGAALDSDRFSSDHPAEPPFALTAAELLSLAAPAFEVVHLAPSAFILPDTGWGQLEFILVRR